MPRLDVHLFGKLRVHRSERQLENLDSRKVQELFCYLLLHRDRPHPRETLAGLLWGETSTAQSRANLRRTICQLQRALGDQGCALLVDEWVQIAPQADLWLDVARFEQAFALVQAQPGERLDDRCAKIVEEAVALYTGDLLGGCYQDWCLFERERLQNIYLALLDKLMAYCEAHRTYEQGLGYGTRILRCDRAHEQTHRRMMRLRYLAGDRTAALRQYQRCVAALQEELGIAPTELTQALYVQIRANRLEEPDAPGAAAPTLPLGDFLSDLCGLAAALAATQGLVQEQIRAVERILDAR